MVDDDPIFPDDDLVDGVVSSDSDDDDDSIDPLHDVVLFPKSFANPNDVVLSSSPAEAADVTVAVTPTPPYPPPPSPPKNPASAAFTVPLTVTTPTTTQKPIDDSRRLFQRLWTDEDEIELLQGFLDYTASRGGVHHQDTTAFYDQIKGKFQLEFNKNQLVEKLRRLKKKYRTNVSRMNSGKDFVFKSPHDQATFKLSRRIWFSLSGNYGGSGGGVVDFDDDEQNPNPNPNHSYYSNNNNNNVAIAAATPPRVLNNSLMMSHINLNSSSPGGGNVSGGGGGFELMSLNSGGGGVGGLPKLSTRKRQKVVGKVEEKFVKTEAGIINNNASMIDNVGNNVVTNDSAKNTCLNSPLQGFVMETLKNCLSPVLKEVINNTVNGATNASPNAKGEESPGFKGVGALALNAVPLHFAGVNFGGEMEEKWRKQQIMELEVYSKRLELVQEQVKLSLAELMSKEG